MLKIKYLYGENAEKCAAVVLGEEAARYAAQKGAVCLFEGETLLGMLLFHFENCPVIDAVKILEEKRKRGYGDFLTRACLLSFSASGDVKTSYFSSYYEKFGFEKEGNGMLCKAGRITFPHNCQNKGE